MDYYQAKIKGVIRESIWKGILQGSHVATRENPMAVAELLEQNHEYLNAETEDTWNKIVDLMIADTVKEGEE